MAARLASQSIHITTTPMPRSLTESKQILSALQKFGEVVTFRNLKYDTTNTSPNPASRSIIAIFESPSSASQAIAASPLTIPLVQPPPQPQSQSYLPPREPGTPSPDPWASSENAAVQSHITCTIQPSRHNHESALRRNPFHTLFHVNGKSWQARDLVKTGIPLRELADVPLARKSHEPFRVKRKVQAENERLGATSLMALYEGGLRGEEGGDGSNSGERTVEGKDMEVD
ncbi:hypothetical protein BDV38DRAFT_288848 [Aspergillus pseudotamarii]|uniref:Uncharacterized protein n=1 Tax=Aspergillus pseudotamarii TaxID=132259 RepID=A0A5N6S9E5_ASPPS|nr:uncharacterized protein BDV38DRAFT_288848 [Aspergillus pseudotamarii]KAE8131282.1 hypothetical protein BDV38DRAFT_288848 [Aspergillus pseudotamarii]